MFGVPAMFGNLLRRLAATPRRAARALHRHLLAATRPPLAPLIVGTLANLPRTRAELLLESALLRQQLVTRPRCTPADRALLVILASRLHTWRQALLIVQPNTVLRWHRQLFRCLWRR
jgi:hypothetical protein